MDTLQRFRMAISGVRARSPKRIGRRQLYLGVALYLFVAAPMPQVGLGSQSRIRPHTVRHQVLQGDEAQRYVEARSSNNPGFHQRWEAREARLASEGHFGHEHLSIFHLTITHNMTLQQWRARKRLDGTIPVVGLAARTLGVQRVAAEAEDCSEEDPPDWCWDVDAEDE